MINQLQSILGDKDAQAKFFVKFWLSWGHPSAFVSETEARMWQELYRLRNACSVCGPMPLEVLKQRIRVLTLTSQGKTIPYKLKIIASRLIAGDLDVAAGI